jgi:general secretion pathway protein D
MTQASLTTTTFACVLALAAAPAAALPIEQPAAFAQTRALDRADVFAQDKASEPRLAQAATAPKKCKKRRGTFHFQFEEAAIFDVLKQISLITCKNFIVSEGVKGGKKELTIISRKPVSVDAAYSAFLSALEANNMALIPTGSFYKVVERKEAAKESLPMYEKGPDGKVRFVDQGDIISYNDAHITYLHELRYATKDQAQPLLRNLMSKTGDLQVVGANLLIITDSASNVRRLIHILDRIDVAGAGNRIHIVNVEYAEANAVASKLTDIFGQATVRPTPPKTPATVGAEGGAQQAEEPAAEPVTIDKIVADERTNKLIIIASDSAFRHIKELIDVLDVPSSDAASTGARVFVRRLNNADAQKVSSTLSSLAQGSARTANSRNNKKGGKASADQAASLFEGEVKVTADDSTNSLVITASARDYRSLEKVIEELDVRRPQVFVEAAILEVSLNQDRNFGINAYSGLPVAIPGLEGTGLGFVANEGGQQLITSSAQLLAAQSLFQRLNTNNLDANTLSSAAQAATGLETLLGWVAFQGPAVPGSEDIFGFPIPSFGMVLNALQNNANVDVLSTPHIMTTDNEKAEISVGEKVPVVRGISNFGGGGGGFGFGGLQQVAYEPVSLTFTVTPSVNKDDEIRLELEQEVSDLGEQIPVGNGLTQPVITNRTAKTTVVVRDQQTMVIGGLISNRSSDSERKFPVLGDLPLIGWLFKTWSDQDQKTNLIIVLTPYIVRSREDFQKIYERKMQERQEFLDAYYGAAQQYNPYIDYDKKTGPLANLVTAVGGELSKIENGGPGQPGEVLVTPETSVEPFGTDSASDDEGEDGGNGGDEADVGGDDAGGNDGDEADVGADDAGGDDVGGDDVGGDEPAAADDGDGQ